MGPMGPMPPVPQQPQAQQQVYDAPNCDYDPPSYMEQNFGNPYDCPEGMYNGSMMSSVGYSQVSPENTETAEEATVESTELYENIQTESLYDKLANFFTKK